MQVAGKSVDLPAPMAVTMPAGRAGGPPQRAGPLHAPARVRRGSRCWPPTCRNNSSKNRTTRPTRARRSSFPARSRDASRRPAIAISTSSRPRRASVSCSAGQTRALGSPSDLFMRLYNADGGVLAEAEDNGNGRRQRSTSRSRPMASIACASKTRIAAAAATKSIGSWSSRIRPASRWQRPPKKSTRPQNGVFVVKVTAARRDYNGPITLSVEGAGEGCTLRHNIIPEGKPETTMHVTLGPALQAGQIGDGPRSSVRRRSARPNFAPRPARWRRCGRRVCRPAVSARRARRPAGPGRGPCVSAVLSIDRRRARRAAGEAAKPRRAA